MSAINVPSLSGGNSLFADSVATWYNSVRESQRGTVTFGDTYNKLINLSFDCSIEGWDGYESFSINMDTVRNAEKLINSLPLTLPTPEIGVEPDGQITFEWYRNLPA